MARGDAQPALVQFGFRFGDGLAAAADQKGWRMVAVGMNAGGVGVQLFDTVGQTVLHEKVERPVVCGRLRTETILGQFASIP